MTIHELHGGGTEPFAITLRRPDASAMRLSWDNAEDVHRWVGPESTYACVKPNEFTTGKLEFLLPSGATAHVGDWIVKDEESGTFSPWRHKEVITYYEAVEHLSDCATNNEPAMPAGPCNCVDR
jgi:hypothetical protein